MTHLDKLARLPDKTKTTGVAKLVLNCMWNSALFPLNPSLLVVACKYDVCCWMDTYPSNLLIVTK